MPVCSEPTMTTTSIYDKARSPVRAGFSPGHCLCDGRATGCAADVRAIGRLWTESASATGMIGVIRALRPRRPCSGFSNCAVNTASLSLNALRTSDSTRCNWFACQPPI